MRQFSACQSLAKDCMIFHKFCPKNETKIINVISKVSSRVGDFVSEPMLKSTNQLIEFEVTNSVISDKVSNKGQIAFLKPANWPPQLARTNWQTTNTWPISRLGAL